MKLTRVFPNALTGWSGRLATGGLVLSLCLATPISSSRAATGPFPQEDPKALAELEAELAHMDGNLAELNGELAAELEQVFAIAGDKQRSFIGVFSDTISDDKATELGLKKAEGVYIQNVVPGGPAEKAGIKSGDVILEINGTEIVNGEHFRTILGKSEPGSQLKLTIFRDKKKQNITVTTEARGQQQARVYGFGQNGQVLSDEQRKQIEKEMQKAAKASEKAMKDYEKAFKGNEKALREAEVFAYAFQDAGRLGVNSQSLSEQLSAYFGVKGGVLVTEVESGSAAEKAGVKAGDCITAINGVAINDTKDLRQELRKAEAGNVSLTVVRDKQTLTLNATIEKRQPFKQGALFFPSRGRLGVSVDSLSTQLAQSMGVNNGGVLITEVKSGSAAEKAGLKAGDCITAINNQPVKDSSDLIEELAKVKEGNVTLSIVRDRQPTTITATLDKVDESYLRPLRMTLPTRIQIPPMRIRIPRLSEITIGGSSTLT